MTAGPWAPILGAVLVVTFSLLLLVGVGGIPVAARLAGHSVLTVLAVLLGESIGLLFVGFGLLAVAYNGYVEDAGVTAARTLPVALPLLALGLAVMASGWLVARAPAAEH